MRNAKTKKAPIYIEAFIFFRKDYFAKDANTALFLAN